MDTWRPRPDCKECGREYRPLRRGFCPACYQRRRLRGEFAADIGKLSGEVHGQYRGDVVTRHTGRWRAQRRYGAPDRCEQCGAAPVERHHKDGNPVNNAAPNIAFLCRRCHMQVDGRLGASSRRMAMLNKGLPDPGLVAPAGSLVSWRMVHPQP